MNLRENEVAKKNWHFITKRILNEFITAYVYFYYQFRNHLSECIQATITNATD